MAQIQTIWPSVLVTVECWRRVNFFVVRLLHFDFWGRIEAGIDDPAPLPDQPVGSKAVNRLSKLKTVNQHLMMYLVILLGLSGCTRDDEGSGAVFLNSWRQWSRSISKKDQYSLIVERKFDAGPGIPPSITNFSLLRDGKNYAVIVATDKQKYALLANDRYSCKLVESSVPGKWLLNDYQSAGTGVYREKVVAYSHWDCLQSATSADRVFSYWNELKDVTCELKNESKTQVLEMKFDYTGKGRDFLPRHQLDKNEVPRDGKIFLDTEKLLRGEPAWLLSWDIHWSYLLQGKEYIKHKRVEASDWKRVGILDREIPTVLNSFTDEPGEEIWYMSRTIKDAKPLNEEDLKMFYMSGFGLPEIKARGNWMWIGSLISIVSAIGLFFVVRKIRKSR